MSSTFVRERLCGSIETCSPLSPIGTWIIKEVMTRDVSVVVVAINRSRGEKVVLLLFASCTTTRNVPLRETQTAKCKAKNLGS